MKTKFYFLFVSLLVILFVSCEESIPEPEYTIIGVVQKGPFRLGSSVTVSILNSSLIPTGITYHSTITDNYGSYEIHGVKSESGFVELVADGFYYDETKNEVSDERILLRLLANIENSTVVNINCITSLSYDRIRYLVTKEEKTFDEAKKKAQEEILKTFCLESKSYENDEHLDIQKYGELNSKLLAITTILQEDNGVATLSELMAGFALDLKTDGTIDDELIQQKLITSAIKCNPDAVCQNLAELYTVGSIDNFQPYIDQFVNTTAYEPLVTSHVYTVRGCVQKGPFRTGTTITVSELEEGLTPTGLNYYSTVTDNYGNFEIPGVELESGYVELMADGFYYHENFNIVTSERLVMKAIANLADSSTANVNIVTHLTYDRIKYLCQQEGKTFAEAKQQAERELLRVFNFEEEAETRYEYIDITQKGELASKLFAISMIVQGFKNVSPLSEFLTSLAQDFKTDGTIDHEESQKSLITSALFCNVGGIRKNIKKLYGINDFPDFQSCINTFIGNTEFEPFLNFRFSQQTPLGENLLALPDNSVLSAEKNYCMNIDLDLKESYRWFGITLLEEEGKGNVTYIENDLTNWIYDDNYSGNFEGAYLYGINLMALVYENNISQNPIIIKFRNTGKIRLTIYIENDLLPDNGHFYFIEKYFTW